jgi:hypothetical protein
MHMLCIFDPDTARPPLGLTETLQDDHLRRTSSEVERTESLKLSQERLAHLPVQLAVAEGINWAYQPSTYCHYAEQDGVHAMFAGEVTEWPGIDMMASAHDAFVRGDPEPGAGDNDATWLLKFYETFKECAADKTMPAALASLAHTQGRFAWIIYDAGQRRVLAARDRGPKGEPLFWGMTPDQRFMLGSRLSDLEDGCRPTATQFPAGSLFTSTGTSRAVQTGQKGWVMPGDLWPGQVRAFVEKRDHTYRAVRAVPRINSRGAMCGAVYRVASELDLGGGDGPSTVF